VLLLNWIEVDVQIYLTPKRTNRLQYSVVQVRGQIHRELCCKN
jgi:hypothetical protein